MLDRTKAPAPTKIENIEIPLAQKHDLANGIPFYYLDLTSQEAVKIDLVLAAGTRFEKIPGTSFMVSKMLMEGTHQLSSNQIVTKLDYYGAFVEASSGFDHLTVSIYCLNKFLQPVCELVRDILTNCSFPDHEFKLVKNIKIQELKINANKNNLVASKHFRHNVFGDQHAYGYILEPRDLEDLEIADVVDFYHAVLLNEPKIIVSGMVTDTELEVISEVFGSLQTTITDPPTANFISLKTQEMIEVPDSMQSSIRIGKRTINRNHKDTHKLAITNSILGGFFGSRLMKNIREDKGYTYGIYSSVAHLQEASFMVISTDVKRDFTEDTTREIQFEINKLRSQLIEKEELELVTNYLTGQFLSGLDSPFNIANKFKVMQLQGLDYQFYYAYLDTLKTISSKEILETAEQYFEPNFTEVIVGGY